MDKYNIEELLEKDYLDIYEKIYLEDRCEFLFAVWRDIILINSSKKFSELEKEKQLILIETDEQFNLCNIVNIKIGKMDKPAVLMLLRIAAKLKRISIIDFIYKRTKSSAIIMPEYFYPEQIIYAYIGVLEIEKAKSVLIYLSELNHRSYWYRILDMNVELFKNYPEYLKLLRNIRIQSIANLIKSGETIKLNLDLQTFNDINQYI